MQSAEYMYNKHNNEDLLSLGFNHNKEIRTEEFSLVSFSNISSILVFIFQVCTGHSLGGGTAAILAILLREDYPDVTCYAFSPPGELLR